jgi:peptide/nickel transport system substrate-binding protein
VRLSRVSPDPLGDAVAPTIILRWAADPGARTAALRDASVDGIDAPGPADLDAIATLPELSVIPRDGLATAYLAFGTGAPFGSRAVRRAIAESLDREALVAGSFPAGSAVPTHLVPCVVPLACGGDDWYPFNAPEATAALAAASVNLSRTYQLHIPDQPVPGLTDPPGLAAAVQAQLATNIGLKVAIDVMPLSDYAAGIADGSLDGLYLGGLASPVADPAVFLGPLFGPGATGLPARRSRRAVNQLARAASTADPLARASAFATANDAIRTSSPVIPLAHPGSTVVFRSDVGGAATAPLGNDALGAVTPGDRRQLVFMQASEPDGAYCADQSPGDAYRLCGLVLQGLYGFRDASLVPVPVLARSCDPDADALVWTCRLVNGVTFHDGATLDAADVVASFVAQWDRTQPLRAGSDRPFAAWDALFGDTLR